ncbi:putative transcription factor interactor and regulator CCHC(Zn) family [Helianthus anomalus]
MNSNVKDVSHRTCFKFDQVGHIGRKCPNLKPVDVDKKKSDAVNQKSTKFESKQTWKPNISKAESQQNWKPVTPRFKIKQSWNTTADLTKPHQFWKPKTDLSKQNIQNDSRFCQSNVLKGQIWVVKAKTSRKMKEIIQFYLGK